MAYQTVCPSCSAVCFFDERPNGSDDLCLRCGGMISLDDTSLTPLENLTKEMKLKAFERFGVTYLTTGALLATAEVTLKSGDLDGALRQFEHLLGLECVPAEHRCVAVLNRGMIWGAQMGLRGIERSIADFDLGIALFDRLEAKGIDLRDDLHRLKARAQSTRAMFRLQNSDKSGARLDFQAVMENRFAPSDSRVKASNWLTNLD